MIIEILSPSTSVFDRSQKVEDYQEILSVQTILLVYTDARRVRVWRRDGPRWIVEDVIGSGAVVVTEPELSLPLGRDLWRGSALSPT